MPHSEDGCRLLTAPRRTAIASEISQQAVAVPVRLLPSAEGAPIRVRLWFILLALAGAACGGGTTDATQTTAGASGASGPDLSGLSLEVHQAPG